MRHLINFGLLFTFTALAVTGLLSFTRPFSITTTQIHITVGLLTVLLVILHIVGRLSYFKIHITKPRPTAISRPRKLQILVVVLLLALLAGKNLPPVSWLLDLGYESRNRAHIVRSSSLAAFGELSSHRKLVARQTEASEAMNVSLLLHFNEITQPLPSIAVWAETTTGTLIETLYLEQSLAYSDKPVWDGIRTQRNHILPIWRHRYTMVSGIDPDGEIDGVTGATADHQFALDPYLQRGEGNSFVLCVELNAPGDANESWTDTSLGQPSLLYTALVNVDEEQAYRILELTGHGGGAETSGNIQYHLEGITTARSMVDLLLLKLETP